MDAYPPATRNKVPNLSGTGSELRIAGQHRFKRRRGPRLFPVYFTGEVLSLVDLHTQMQVPAAVGTQFISYVTAPLQTLDGADSGHSCGRSAARIGGSSRRGGVWRG